MGAYISGRMEDLNNLTQSNSGSGSEDDSDSEAVRQYAALLQSLINSEMVPEEHLDHLLPVCSKKQTYLQKMIQMFLWDRCCAWPIAFQSFYSGQVEIMSNYFDGDYGPQIGAKMPKIKYKPNCTLLNKSEFSQITKLASGLIDDDRKKISKNVVNILERREKGLDSYTGFTPAKKAKINNRFLPNGLNPLDSYNGKVFCGIYSKDGKYFLTASQDRLIRIYNSGDGSYSILNTIKARDVGWSIIDVAFSPDNKHFVYSTWSSSLHLCSTTGDPQQQEPLSLVKTSRRFCVFSVMFSSDGKELLGGANDGCLYIYDRQHNNRTLQIPAHEYDVNSVSFADQSSQIIYSGGDDGLIKVWDRRTLDESSPKPVGILAGHMDGITFIDSKGDGRHLISNSKDQSIKLWDVRVFSGAEAAEKTLNAVHEQTWDYRWQQVPKKLFGSKHTLEGDTSIMTYKGHVVIKTLVRCRFSPIESTGQRYIYTGSGTGALVIYDALTGKIDEMIHGHVACVRDVSWHPYRPEIITSSWDGNVGQWLYSDKTPNLRDVERETRNKTLEGKILAPHMFKKNFTIAGKRERL